MLRRNISRTRATLARLTGETDDDRARRSGWEIERGRFGRRVYRDPRFAARRVAVAAPLAMESPPPLPALQVRPSPLVPRQLRWPYHDDLLAGEGGR